ncbi:M23 family metallopeptidase [Paenibacillus segetis]|uniref:M23ase beta-sheet core domain-containing protein n=1 Tax=Paenibacillus segetis TaxID=1325360 RepID=A0ABQ1Y2A5_9BACL|nr:M23 family metallopeptidase [Paenibacillus segetis]GGH10312.1 hypothetical protein GCM10008013_01730 [Paenibacillus segetis]
MYLSRAQAFMTTIVLFIILPILILLGLYLGGKNTIIDNLIYVFFAANFIFILFRAAYWEFTNYYLRYAYVLIFLVIAIRNLFFIDRSLQSMSDWNVGIDVVVLIVSFILLYLNIAIIRASKKPSKHINLSFPFKNGRYIVTDGGDGNISSLLNYHSKAQVHKSGKSNTSMRFATDIAKMNKIGCTVTSVLTKENKDYEIFHEEVYSPCEANVINVVDEIEDNIPFSRKYPYNVGNCVTLKLDHYYIVMGHLAKGTIAVKPGDRVKPGQLLGIIGNAGLTPRPHLHMQVSECEDGQYWQGESIPIVFNNSYYPVKNKVIKV